jgi:hypothetical protein
LGPRPASPTDQAGAAPTVAVEVMDPRSTALASGAGRLAADGSVVFRDPAGPAPALGPDVGLDGLGRGGPAETVAAGPAAGPPTGPSPAPPPAASSQAGDLDELAGRLYDRIRGRLKAELRLDRERIGQLSDLRH